MITRPSSGTDRLAQLRRVPSDLREEEWEGEIAGEGGSVEGIRLDFRARLQVWGGALAGTGRLTDVETEEAGLSLAGTRQGSAVELLVWLEASEVAAEPLVCAGRWSADGTAIEGPFAVACLSPSTCDCGGGRGRIALRRAGR